MTSGKLSACCVSNAGASKGGRAGRPPMPGGSSARNATAATHDARTGRVLAKPASGDGRQSDFVPAVAASAASALQHFVVPRLRHAHLSGLAHPLSSEGRAHGDLAH